MLRLDKRPGELAGDFSRRIAVRHFKWSLPVLAAAAVALLFREELAGLANASFIGFIVIVSAGFLLFLAALILPASSF